MARYHSPSQAHRCIPIPKYKIQPFLEKRASPFVSLNARVANIAGSQRVCLEGDTIGSLQASSSYPEYPRDLAQSSSTEAQKCNCSPPPLKDHFNRNDDHWQKDRRGHDRHSDCFPSSGCAWWVGCQLSRNFLCSCCCSAVCSIVPLAARPHVVASHARH